MKNNYSVEEFIKTSLAYIYTKIFFNKARLIRRPVYIRGKKFLRYHSGFTTGYNCRLEMFNINKINEEKLIIGKECRIGDHVHIAAGEKVVIGNNCLFASKVYISDISHGEYKSGKISSPWIAPNERELKTNPVKIGDNVWIGEGVSVLPGVNIGSGCVIGANSVVNKDIPDNCIAVGVPAKVVKRYNGDTGFWEPVKKKLIKEYK